MQISECLFMAAELLHVDSGHQASPVLTIILSFLNIPHTLLVQPICFIKAASACILEGLHADVYHLYTKPLTLVKTNSCLLSHTLLAGPRKNCTIILLGTPRGSHNANEFVVIVLWSEFSSRSHQVCFFNFCC